MKLSLSPYELNLRHSSGLRKGYLLRIEDSAGAYGYADIFPWTEFGDPSFEEIPTLLKSKNFNPPLLERSFEAANLDLNGRVAGISLMNSIKFQNHFLVGVLNSLEPVEDALKQGFVKFKIKCGRDLKSELSFLKKVHTEFKDALILRLDFNGKLKKEDEKLFWPYLDFIEFVEDPYAVPELWKDSKLPLAFDHPGFDDDLVSFDWRVIKPAKQLNPKPKKEKVVFTSYLGHPVGTAHASYQASLFGEPMTEYGLMSESVYKSNPFNEHLIKRGPELSFQAGLGIGFNTLLKEQKWTEL